MLKNDKKHHYGLIGDPVSHSRSPEIYAPMFKKFNIDGDFALIRLPQGEISRVRSIIAEYGLSGFAVTMPHKKAILSELDEIDELAKASGAVNIVTIENGRLVGHNTDGRGLVLALCEAGVAVKNASVVIFGDGGAATAAKAALEAEGAEVTLVTREYADGKILEAAAGASEQADICDAIALFERETGGVSSADIIINATPLGMIKNHANDAEASEDFSSFGFIDFLKPSAAVMDVVYRPDGTMTRLLQAAKAAGHKAIAGNRMLYYQGVLAFKLWTGFDYEK